MTINYELNDGIIITETGRLQLEDFSNGVVFYSNFDINKNANINIGDSIPIENNSATLIQTNTGKFSKGLSIRGDSQNQYVLLYEKENFEEVTNEGSISLWVNFYSLGDSFHLLDFVDTNDIDDVDNNHHRIQLVYDGVGFNLKMNGDSDAVVVNDQSSITNTFVSGDMFHHLEINWNRNIYQLFIDGELNKVGQSSFNRTDYGSLIIGSKQNSSITIDELIVKDKYNNITDFTVPDASYTQYPTSNPYQDVPIGDSFVDQEVSSVTIEGSDNLKFYVKSGDTFFKPVNNEWTIVTNEEDYDDSSTLDEIRDNITNFPFDPAKEIKFRTFFSSNGFTQSYLDGITINKIEGPIISKDYARLYTYARVKLGAPIIPVELTDEQIQTCIEDTRYNWHRYRNRKEAMEVFELEGSYGEGWVLPPNVEADDIIDVIIRPTIPFGYYTGRNDLLGNLYLQYLFQQGGQNISSNIADFRITMSALKDFSILLGTQPKWEILGGRIKIWPEPPAGMKIGLRFMEKIVPDDVLEDNFFRELFLAEVKILLGTIRSTFPGGIPAGENLVQLNGESLLQEGKQEKEKAMDRMKRAQQPLFLDFF